MKTLLRSLAILGLFCGIVHAGIVNGTANLVLGQPDFRGSTPTVAGLEQPRCVAVDTANHRVYVADYGHNRVLWWDTAISTMTNGKAPDGVLGQANFSATDINRGGAPAANTLFNPSGLAVDASGNLWVADFGNHRVLRYSLPLSNGKDADLVLGQTAMTEGHDNPTADNTLCHPIELCFDPSGNLWVSDFQDHRVLRFRPPFATHGSADLVLGQKNFTLNRHNDTNGDGVSDSASAGTFYYPDGIFVDSGGGVWVADHLNQRVLRFSGALSNGRDADLVLGANDFASHTEPAPAQNLIRCAYSVWGDRGGNIWVTDTTNNRLLRFSGSLTNGMNASQVIGQAGYATSSANRGNLPGADTLYFPCFVTVDGDGNLWVSEWNNNRVLKYNTMKLASLDVTRALNTGPKDFVLTGEGMVAGTTVKLVKPGQADITATSVVLVSESQVRCTFDLTGAVGGMWDVVVENNGLTATLAAALEVVPVKLASVTPDRAYTTGLVTVTLTGENFYDGIAPALKQAGQADIAARFVTLVSSAQLTCQFDLTDAPTGYWNVTVPPANADATLENGFQVFFPSSVVRAILPERAYRLGIETPRGIVILELPAGAFARQCVLSMAEPVSMPDIDPEMFIPTDVAAEIDNDQALPLLKTASLSFFYNGSAVAGLDRSKLVVSFHEKGVTKWLQANSIAYASAGKVVAKLRSFSIFRVVQRVVKPDLASAVAYPNPYRPGTGGAYDDTAMGRGIVFGNLTNRSTIKIFTMTGDQVIAIDETSGTGVRLWNTENDKGEKAASGVYLYVITNPDDSSQKRKGTFSIIR